jgi:hypothetical protein
VFRDVTLSDAHTQALACAGDTEIRLDHCRLDDDGQTLMHCLESGLGPTKLSIWNELELGTSSMNDLLDAVGQNQGMQSLDLFCLRLDARQYRALARAIANNKSLVRLVLFCRSVQNAHWLSLCQSLRYHPSLQTLIVRYSFPFPPILSDAQKNIRTMDLLHALQHNTILTDIRIPTREHNPLLFPALEAHMALNRLRPVIQKLLSTNNVIVDDDFVPSQECTLAPALWAEVLAQYSEAPQDLYALFRMTMSLWLHSSTSQSGNQD